MIIVKAESIVVIPTRGREQVLVLFKPEVKTVSKLNLMRETKTAHKFTLRDAAGDHVSSDHNVVVKLDRAMSHETYIVTIITQS
jgi:hypothetical protein